MRVIEVRKRSDDDMFGFDYRRPWQQWPHSCLGLALSVESGIGAIGLAGLGLRGGKWLRRVVAHTKTGLFRGRIKSE